MNIIKQYFPEALPTDVPPAKPKKKRATPDADTDLLTVAEKASASWRANPQIILIWKTPEAFADEVQTYKTMLQNTRSSASVRPAQTNMLNVQDETIDNAVAEVKIYIRKKWKDAAEANYHRYGIVKEGKNYRLPKDRDERKNALPLMIAAIEEDGFKNEEYGMDFWNATLANYTAALDAANATDGTVSNAAGNKNEAKKGVKKVLKALRLSVEANYPDTYKEVVRQWGWQKEDY